MNKSNSIRANQAFTLIEMLVVIAIIATLAGILLPVLAGARKRAKIAQVQTEMKNLATAIAGFQAQYGVYPTPATDAAGGVDMTYTNGLHPNSDIIKILLDIDDKNDTRPVNPSHARNPQQNVFLHVKLAANNTAAGVGTDYIYRDPWGNSYVITLDLNYDNKCDDAMLHVMLNGQSLPVPVMIWSYGPDGIPGTKDDIKSW